MRSLTSATVQSTGPLVMTGALGLSISCYFQQDLVVHTHVIMNMRKAGQKSRTKQLVCISIVLCSSLLVALSSVSARACTTPIVAPIRWTYSVDAMATDGAPLTTGADSSLSIEPRVKET
jgi:hypothetical protein